MHTMQLRKSTGVRCVAFSPIFGEAPLIATAMNSGITLLQPFSESRNSHRDAEGATAQSMAPDGHPAERGGGGFGRGGRARNAVVIEYSTASPALRIVPPSKISKTCLDLSWNEVHANYFAVGHKRLRGAPTLLVYDLRLVGSGAGNNRAKAPTHSSKVFTKFSAGDDTVRVEWTGRTDPSCLLSASGTRALRLYDLRSHSPTAVRSASSAHTAPITAIQISPHRPHLLASCSARESTVKIWDFRKWGTSADSTYSEPLCTIMLPHTNHPSAPSVHGVQIDPSGNQRSLGVTIRWSPSNADVIATMGADEPFINFWNIQGGSHTDLRATDRVMPGRGVPAWSQRGSAASSRGSVAALASMSRTAVRVVRTPVARRWVGHAAAQGSELAPRSRGLAANNADEGNGVRGGGSIASTTGRTGDSVGGAIGGSRISTTIPRNMLGTGVHGGSGKEEIGRDGASRAKAGMSTAHGIDSIPAPPAPPPASQHKEFSRGKSQRQSLAPMPLQWATFSFVPEPLEVVVDSDGQKLRDGLSGSDGRGGALQAAALEAQRLRLAEAGGLPGRLERRKQRKDALIASDLQRYSYNLPHHDSEAPAPVQGLSALPHRCVVAELFQPAQRDTADISDPSTPGSEYGESQVNDSSLGAPLHLMVDDRMRISDRFLTDVYPLAVAPSGSQNPGAIGPTLVFARPGRFHSVEAYAPSKGQIQWGGRTARHCIDIVGAMRQRASVGYSTDAAENEKVCLRQSLAHGLAELQARRKTPRNNSRASASQHWASTVSESYVADEYRWGEPSKPRNKAAHISTSCFLSSLRYNNDTSFLRTCDRNSVLESVLEEVVGAYASATNHANATDGPGANQVRLSAPSPSVGVAAAAAAATSAASGGDDHNAHGFDVDDYAGLAQLWRWLQRVESELDGSVTVAGDVGSVFHSLPETSLAHLAAIRSRLVSASGQRAHVCHVRRKDARLRGSLFLPSEGGGGTDHGTAADERPQGAHNSSGTVAGSSSSDSRNLPRADAASKAHKTDSKETSARTTGLSSTVKQKSHSSDSVLLQPFRSLTASINESYIGDLHDVGDSDPIASDREAARGSENAAIRNRSDVKHQQNQAVRQSARERCGGYDVIRHDSNAISAHRIQVVAGITAAPGAGLLTQAFEDDVRARILKLCGWAPLCSSESEGSADLEQLLLACEREADFERAAALALFHCNITLTIRVLARAAEDARFVPSVSSLHANEQQDGDSLGMDDASFEEAALYDLLAMTLAGCPYTFVRQPAGDGAATTANTGSETLLSTGSGVFAIQQNNADAAHVEMWRAQCRRIPLQLERFAALVSRSAATKGSLVEKELLNIDLSHKKSVAPGSPVGSSSPAQPFPSSASAATSGLKPLLSPPSNESGGAPASFLAGVSRRAVLQFRRLRCQLRSYCFLRAICSFLADLGTVDVLLPANYRSKDVSEPQDRDGRQNSVDDALSKGSDNILPRAQSSTSDAASSVGNRPADSSADSKIESSSSTSELKRPARVLGALATMHGGSAQQSKQVGASVSEKPNESGQFGLKTASHSITSVGPSELSQHSQVHSERTLDGGLSRLNGAASVVEPALRAGPSARGLSWAQTAAGTDTWDWDEEVMRLQDELRKQQLLGETVTISTDARALPNHTSSISLQQIPLIQRQRSGSAPPTDMLVKEAVHHQASTIVLSSSALAVLAVPRLPLLDRVAFAARFLPWDQFLAFLALEEQRCANEGRVEGALLVGLGFAGVIGAVQGYVNRTADVQSAALLTNRWTVLAARPKVTGGSREGAAQNHDGVNSSDESLVLKAAQAVRVWTESYREMLNRWKLWKLRCKFDVFRNRAKRFIVLAGSRGSDNVGRDLPNSNSYGSNSTGSVVHETAGSSADMALASEGAGILHPRCLQCGVPFVLEPNGALGGGGSVSKVESMGASSAWLNKGKPVISVCFKCRKTLPRCEVCAVAALCVLHHRLELHSCCRS